MFVLLARSVLVEMRMIKKTYFALHGASSLLLGYYIFNWK